MSQDPTFIGFNENDNTTGVIGINGLTCEGNETRLTECPFLEDAITCEGNDVVEITCQI